MKFIYTKHVEDKLQEEEAKKFKITKRMLESVVKNPKTLQDVKGIKRAIGKLDKKHSLCVIYRFEEEVAKIITFFPAAKGRYEN